MENYKGNLMNEKKITHCNKINGKICEYDILRVITTLLVILSHCGYYNIITKYGGIRYGELTNVNNYNIVTYNIFSHLVEFIYTFHMPLFIALSGALFYIQIKNNRFSSFKLLMENKVKRLIIPFFIVTILYSVPIKLISGYFSNSKNLFKDIIVGQVLIQGNTYLWFLPTLFVCFLIMYIFEKKIYLKYKLVLFLFLNILSYCIPIMIIKYIFKNIIWFYIGFLFEENRKKLNIKLRKYKYLWVYILVSNILLYIFRKSSILNYYFIFKIIDKIFIIFQAIMGCSLIYLLALKLSTLNICNNNIYKSLSKTSFGLYLYSDPINYLILFIIYKSFGDEIFISEVGTIVIIFSRIIITFIISFGITKLLQKFKIKYVV